MKNFLCFGCVVFILLFILVLGVVFVDLLVCVGCFVYLENDVYFVVDCDDQGVLVIFNWLISSGVIFDIDWCGWVEVWVGLMVYWLVGSSCFEFVVVDDWQVMFDLNDGSLVISIFDCDQVNDIIVYILDGSVCFVIFGCYCIDVLVDYIELSVQVGQVMIDYCGWVILVLVGQKFSLSDGG